MSVREINDHYAQRLNDILRRDEPRTEEPRDRLVFAACIIAAVLFVLIGILAHEMTNYDERISALEAKQ
jgi:hypothetical protein